MFFHAVNRNVMKVTPVPALDSTWVLARGATAMVTPAAVTQKQAVVWYVQSALFLSLIVVVAEPALGSWVECG